MCLYNHITLLIYDNVLSFSPASSRICLVIVLSVYCPVLVMYVLSPTILFCMGCLMFEYENQ